MTTALARFPELQHLQSRRPAGQLAHTRLSHIQLTRAQLTRAGELAVRNGEPDAAPPPLPTAIEPLDLQLGGGLPHGLTELVGRGSSGRLSAVLSTVAAVTRQGATAALIDLGDGLDPGNAHDLGVDLKRLLWLRPKHLKPALAAAEIALQTGFLLVAVDLGAPPVPGGRGPDSAWLRLARAARSRRSSILVSTPYRVSGTAATTVVEAQRTTAGWRSRPHLSAFLQTLEFSWLLQKHRHHLGCGRNVSFARTVPEADLGSVD